MRIGLGQTADDCVVGAIDPTTGDTIASCGATGPVTAPVPPATTSIPVCPTGVQVSGTCTCPAGTSLDPTSLMCTSGINASLSNFFSQNMPIVLVAGGFLIIVMLLAGGKKK